MAQFAVTVVANGWASRCKLVASRSLTVVAQARSFYWSSWVSAGRCGCCTLLLLRHEAQCYIARAAGRDERRYLWIWWL